jgi:outer membrane protein assembly factor BamE
MIRSLTFLSIALLVTACAQVPSITSYLTPHRVDVRQGNFVTQEMVAQLKTGQTRDQVRFVLGTPLLADQFHGDRWDYIYRFQPGRGELQQRRLAVFFENNKLARVEGDVTAAAQEAAGRSAIKTVDIPGPQSTVTTETQVPAATGGN